MPPYDNSSCNDDFCYNTVVTPYVKDVVHFYIVNGKVVPVSKHHTMKAEKGHRGKPPLILNHDAECMKGSRPLCQFYHWRKTQYPSHKRLDGLQSWSRHGGKRKCPAPAKNQILIIKSTSQFTVLLNLKKKNLKKT
jgi:hypothetical protein